MNFENKSISMCTTLDDIAESFTIFEERRRIDQKMEMNGEKQLTFQYLVEDLGDRVCMTAAAVVTTY